MSNELDEWPDCALGGCNNKSCLALESPYCHPHCLLAMVYVYGADLENFVQGELERLFGESDLGQKG